jgi:NAD+ synthase (glutamine-hydrolysing)
MHGATVMVNLSASDEVTGKNAYRRELVVGQSARLYCGYLYVSAGDGESTQDVVYSGHNLIAESGQLLEESPLFSTGCIMSELDVNQIQAKRRTMSTYQQLGDGDYRITDFSLKITETSLTRRIDRAPFVPGKPATLQRRCEEILDIQSMGLVKRLSHTGCHAAVLGISGGLDSTLALLVTVRAFDILEWERKGIIAVTMPGFGTTDRTYHNAVTMIQTLGVTFREIPIGDAVRVHFADIGQDENVHDVTYENGQARERTQILMDIANKEGGMVIGTGDMSELALGWATYNGDHMSMYGVNVSVPKTLVRHLVQFYADHTDRQDLAEVLRDVLDTPVSPELLPPEDGVISQKTEELVGPYELHDFFLYYLMRYGCEPAKIFRLAKIAFHGIYDSATILKWEKVFYRRFFSQQFKRSCLPDGPKVGTVSLSPRGDLRMPSDACVTIWMEQLDALTTEKTSLL